MVKAEKRLEKKEYDALSHLREAVRSAEKHDMVSSPDEPYYKEQYWHWIKKYLDSEKMPVNGTYLGLGCGQGRLTMPLAQWCREGKVIGVDLSEKAVIQAQSYAKENNILNIDYRVQDIHSFLKSEPSDSYDGALFIEVIFFLPEYEGALREIKRVLKPGGLLFASFRSQYFTALNIANRRNWNDVDLVLEKRADRLGGSDVCFTWQTGKEIRQLMQDKTGFEVLNLLGIGCCSGIEGDPHAYVARPSFLDREGKEALMKLETSLAESVPDAGRYVLCIAKK